MKIKKQNGAHMHTDGQKKPVLITGGAGFIGSNVAHRLLTDGRDVVLLDNLSRKGVDSNARWLANEFGSRVRLVVGDTRDERLVRELVSEASSVFHFAAQVAVTTSLEEPLQDFEVNVRGTLNVLEAIRAQSTPPPLLYTSTNKVYGSLEDVELLELPRRYVPACEQMSRRGVDETRPLDFHSPYGCSKGAADQYVIDYARSFGIPATVFRMSCIYGPRQFGNEDQGWVAHFLIRAHAGQPLTIYGDGKQVRDVLYVGDLVEAMLAAERNIHDVSGQAFNMGGGAGNVLSLLELLDLAFQLTGTRPSTRHESWRTGDQRYYVSCTERFRQQTGWSPKVNVVQGIELLYRWLVANGVAEKLRAQTVVPAAVTPSVARAAS